MSRKTSAARIARYLILPTLAGLAIPVTAAVLHVGPGCTYNTNSGASAALQAAVTQAKANPGADTIAITGNLNITATVTVRDAAALTIEGGYASCIATASSGVHSTLDANNLALTSSVIYQTSDNGSGSKIGGNLTLKHLNIRNANSNIDPNSDLYGGAIQSVLPSSPTLIGTLNLIDVSIDHNHAGYGAGLWIEGDDQTHAKLNITDSLFEYNNANFDGGGVYASKTDITIAGDSELNINIGGAAGTGSGDGGGIFAQNSNITVKGHTPTDRYFLNSNVAYHGGGLCLVENSGGPYQVTMQNDRADQPLVVNNNSANYSGGGFYLSTSSSTEEIITTVSLWNMSFTFNSAQAGSGDALFIQAYDAGGSFPNITTVTMAQSGSGDSIPPCVPGLECNAIDDNDGSGNSNHGGDAIVSVTQGSTANALAGFHLNRGRMRGNFAGHALIGGNGYFTADSSLVSGNTINSGFLFDSFQNTLTISNSTIAANTLAASKGVVAIQSGTLNFYHDLVDQPNAYVCSASAPVATNVVDLGVSIGTVLQSCTGTNVQFGGPAFVDPANGDFHLKFNSQAIDRWSASGNSFVPTVDLDGYPRPHFGLATYPYDFGAYEYGSERIFANGFEPP